MTTNDTQIYSVLIFNPTENLWFICYADGVRQPLKFNKHNQFWVALAGKTYKPNEIERWLDA